MKAIILAAGMGTRLEEYTKDLPKGMLKFEGKSLIERQVDTLRAEGINDIVIVKGYNPEKITIQGVEYKENQNYETTNMVATLMEAKENLLTSPDGALVCYADIIYEKRLIRELLKCEADVGVLVDDKWVEYWKARLDEWQEDVESLQYDESDHITEIGTQRCDLKHAKSRYIGLIRFGEEGVRQLITAYEENKQQYWDSNEPWRRSKSFKKAYMTCMLQELIERGVEVKAVHVSHGWMEFDTVEDYERAQEWVSNGTIKNFIDLSRTG